MTDITNLQKLMDANVRIDTVFYPPGQAVQSSRHFDDIFDDFYDADVLSDDASSDLLAMIVKYARLEDCDHNGDRAELFLEEASFRGMLEGFVVQIATPIPQFHAPDYHSYSWGWIATQWIVVESMDAATDLAVKWATDHFEACKKVQRSPNKHH